MAKNTKTFWKDKYTLLLLVKLTVSLLILLFSCIGTIIIGQAKAPSDEFISEAENLDIDFIFFISTISVELTSVLSNIFMCFNRRVR